MVGHVKNFHTAPLRAALNRFRWPALILALGLGLLLLPTGDTDTESAAAETPAQETFSLSEFSSQLETLLGEVSGAGEVRLLLSLEDDGTKSYQTDERRSQGTDTSETQSETVLARVDGDDTAVTQTSTYPAFRGAVVLCQGADNSAVVLAIKEAVSSLTGLGMDHITVLKLQ